MAGYTEFLKLFKYDPTTDGENVFSINQALNENWDKIDAAIEQFGNRNIGEIVASTIPLTDAGLHLLDGALIQGNGIYSDFVDYIADLYNNDPIGNYFLKDGDIPFTQPVMSSNGTMGGGSFAVSASAEVQSGSNPYRAYEAFDDSSATYWRAGAATGWIQFYNPEAIKVTKLTWMVYYNYPTGGNVQGSNDGSSWTTLTTWTNSALSDFDINLSSNTTYYKYYRINVTGVSSDVIHCTQINITGTVYRAAEQVWQDSVSQYGVCGKFVYDSTNNTVRLPKVTGILEGTTDISALGDLVEAGLPNIKGTLNNNAGDECFYKYSAKGTGAIYPLNAHTSHRGTNSNGGDTTRGFGFDASRSSSIYGKSSTVQPQTIKVLYYIVIATSTKTDIQVDIDEIATDMNGKADVDLTNVSDTGYIKMADASMPSDTYDDLTLGASGATYTAPANGYFVLAKASGISNGTITLINGRTTGRTSQDNNMTVRFVSPTTGMTIYGYIPARKGDQVTINYTATGNTEHFIFIYAKGSESEAS